MRKAQNELRLKAASAFQNRVNSRSELTIKDDVSKLGVSLMAGSASSLIEALSFTEVAALLPKEAFQQAKMQASKRESTESTPSG